MPGTAAPRKIWRETSSSNDRLKRSFESFEFEEEFRRRSVSREFMFHSEFHVGNFRLTLLCSDDVPLRRDHVVVVGNERKNPIRKSLLILFAQTALLLRQNIRSELLQGGA